jgi:RNA polymerase sigma factor (sigma-70 family)
MSKEDAHDLASLLAAARDGDRAALERLVGQLRAFCKVLARSWLGHDLSLRQADSDVAQDAVLAIWKQFPAFRGQTAAELIAWVRRIAHGSAVDWKRRHGLPTSHPAGEPPAPAPPPLEQVEHAEEVMRVFAALERMPARRRQVVELRLIDRLPHAKIAERLGASEAATRVLFFRALDQLRGLLEEGRA